MHSTTRRTRIVLPLQRVGLLFAMILCGLLCLIALSGCSGEDGEDDGDMDPPASSPMPPSSGSQSVTMGTYRGMTSQTLPIEIQVGANNVIERLVLRIRMSVGTGTCTADFTPTGASVAITSGQFRATVSPPSSQGVSSTVNGSFQGTAVSGSYEGFSGQFSLVCGSQLITGTGSLFSSGTFTAAL